MKKGQKKEKSNIGERLKLLRGDALQETIANEVGVSNAVYSNFEIGKSEPSLLIASRLANYFGVSLDSLVNGESVEKTIEAKTGLSSEAIRVLKRINRTCEDREIPNIVNQLIEKSEFYEAIKELICTIIILLNDPKGTTDEKTAKVVHKFNVEQVLHVKNGGLDNYQGVFLEIARLHAEDAKNRMNKAIDKVRTEVWNNGTCETEL